MSDSNKPKGKNKRQREDDVDDIGETSASVTRKEVKEKVAHENIPAVEVIYKVDGIFSLSLKTTNDAAFVDCNQSEYQEIYQALKDLEFEANEVYSPKMYRVRSTAVGAAERLFYEKMMELYCDSSDLGITYTIDDYEDVCKDEIYVGYGSDLSVDKLKEISGRFSWYDAKKLQYSRTWEVPVRDPTGPDAGHCFLASVTVTVQDAELI